MIEGWRGVLPVDPGGEFIRVERDWLDVELAAVTIPAAELARLREQVRVLREALAGVMGAEDQMAMPDAHTEAAFNNARAALAATAPRTDPSDP